jgi:peptidyl-tRNA hydrolase, PTH1 family
MHLLIGLGNPGKTYANTRHNVGFMLLDAIAGAYGFPAWQAKFQGHFTSGNVGGVKVGLLKPHTFMNLSGSSVQAAATFYKIAPEQLMTVHDDLDLELGKLKYKRGGSDAGHNGLKSITAALGPNYGRLRIGIDRPTHKSQVADYVLQPFTVTQALPIAEQLAALTSHLPELLEDPVKLLAKLGNST